jgi:hypothetical protein
MRRFAPRGLYNGLMLLGDYETGSYWDHVTGRSVHGPLEGHQLEVFPLFHMHVAMALAQYPGIQVAMSKQTFVQRKRTFFMEQFRKSKGGFMRGFLPAGWQRTLGREDARRPRMDIGVGVWTETVKCFYPLECLYNRGEALIDEFAGRRLLVFVERTSGMPMAFYMDATEWHWQGDTLHLNTGETVRTGVLRDACGNVRAARRPMQMFQRWYGFAFTFPDCDVYGG